MLILFVSSVLPDEDMINVWLAVSFARLSAPDLNVGIS